MQLGVLGTSDWAEMMHIGPAAADPSCALVAVAGRDRARTSDVAQRHGCQGLVDLDAFFSADLDSVAVCVPNALHAPLVKRALLLGLNVFCDKPLARTLSEATELAELAQRSGRVCMTCFTHRWQPHFQAVRGILDSGQLGQIGHVRIDYVSAWARGGEDDWHFDEDVGGDGVIMDLGVHIAYLLDWWRLDIEHIAGTRHSMVPRSGTGCDAASALCLGQGFDAHIRASAISPLETVDTEHIRVHIEGNEATLTLDFTWGGSPRLELQVHGRPPTELRLPADLARRYGAATTAEAAFSASLLRDRCGIRAFIAAVHGEAPAEPSFDEGLRAQRFVDAWSRSARLNQWMPAR